MTYHYTTDTWLGNANVVDIAQHISIPGNVYLGEQPHRKARPAGLRTSGVMTGGASRGERGDVAKKQSRGNSSLLIKMTVHSIGCGVLSLRVSK